MKLRILTVNTHKGFSHFNRKFVLPELRDAVRMVAADLVFLQEVLGVNEVLALRHPETWPEVPHYEFLADSIWNNHAYGRNAVYPSGHHGNALLCKYPITRYENINISIGNVERRGLLHCQIELPDDPITLHAFCVHLGLRESHRQQQLALLCDIISAVPDNEPLILAGDFNDWRGKAGDVLNRCGVTDVFKAVYGVSPKTFPAGFPLLRLDRIYVRGVQEYQPLKLPNSPWSHLSDHAPLAAEVVL